MLLVSENLSDFPFCSHGVVAVDSQDNAEELLATDVRLMLITSAKFGHDSEKPQHFRSFLLRVLEKSLSFFQGWRVQVAPLGLCPFRVYLLTEKVHIVSSVTLERLER